MLSPDCLCTFGILLRSFQILLAMLIIATVAIQNPKGSLASYFIPMVAGMFSILLNVPLLIPRVVYYSTPAVVFIAEILSCLLWKSSLITSSWKFASNTFNHHGLRFAIASMGCSFLGFGVSMSVLVLMACGSIRVASKTGQWKSRQYFLTGGIFQRTDSNASSLCSVCEKCPADDEWTEEGKPLVSLYQHSPASSVDDVYSLRSQPSSLDLKYFRIGATISRGPSIESVSSEAEGFSHDQNYGIEYCDSDSTSSFNSLELQSEISTTKGDNSAIQGIPFADGENDDGGGAGWRRCSSGGNFPQFFED